MVLPVCGKRGQGGEINSKFAEECEPVSGLCNVCQNSVINAVASLPCHFHQPSPAQPSPAATSDEAALIELRFGK